MAHRILHRFLTISSARPLIHLRSISNQLSFQLANKNHKTSYFVQNTAKFSSSTNNNNSSKWLNDKLNEKKVVIFSKTTCPYCQKVKGLFSRLNEPTVIVELDNLTNGREIQNELSIKTGVSTVPQVFINGNFVGGCDKTHELHDSGKLRDLLTNHSYDYDLIVIGGGSGGLSAAKTAVSYGKKVALFDFVKPSPQNTSWGLGGTCVNVGCIPKKLLHQAALLGDSIDDAYSYGWRQKNVIESSNDSSNPEPDIKSTVTHNWSKLIDRVQSHVKMANFNYRVNLREKKVNYINAYASLIDPHTVQAVDKKSKVTSYTGEKIVIATGERPNYPTDCPGALEYAITSDDIFSLPYEPGKTVVIGASYVALECAGFLRGLGYDVTVLVRSILLRGFDQDIAEKIGQSMSDHGIKFIRPSIPTSIEQLKAPTSTEPGHLRVKGKLLDGSNSLVDIDCNTVLFAIGRVPCTKNIGLEKIGVNVDAKTGKVIVNEKEETNVSNIYALGDIVKGKPELTPVAIEAGKLLSHRLFGGQSRLTDYQFIPTTIFTPVEYGCVGYSEEEARSKFGNDEIEVYHQGFRPYEWALSTKSVNTCWAKLITLKKEKERIIGFHFLGPNAGEVTQMAALTLKLGVYKDDFDHLIGIHPTSAEVRNKLNINLLN